MIVKIAHRGPATISLCVRFPELVTKQVDVIDLWHNYFYAFSAERHISKKKSSPTRLLGISSTTSIHLQQPLSATDYINHTCHDKNQSIPHTSRHLLLPSDMNYKEFHDVPSTTPKNGWESRQGVEKADDRGLPAMMMGTPMWTTRAPFTLCPEK